MKFKLLLATTISLITTSATFAQKGELSNAYAEYERCFNTYHQKNLAPIATRDINEAKASIDKAAVNPITATLPMTYAVKGAIYAMLAYRDTSEATYSSIFNIAATALNRAKETDIKGENKKLIDEGYQTLVVIKYDFGLKHYQVGEYEMAYDNFNFYLTVHPDDTTALYLTGLSAENAKKYAVAIANYNKLLTKNYSKNASIYADLGYIYLQQNDIADAIKVLTEGVAKYPDDGMLAKKLAELKERK